MDPQQDMKARAAAFALQYVRSGMRLGLGSGSTSAIFVDLLAEKLRRGELGDIQAVATSQATAARAESKGIPLHSLTQLRQPGQALRLDLAVDGADEVDPHLNLVKGLGHALLREKIVELHAEQFIVIVDESKLAPRLCSRVPLPVDILRYEYEVHLDWLSSIADRAALYRLPDGNPVLTDDGNFMALCWFEQGLVNPHAIAERLSARAGIVEHGLFLNMASRVIVAGQGGVHTLENNHG